MAVKANTDQNTMDREKVFNEDLHYLTECLSRISKHCSPQPSSSTETKSMSFAKEVHRLLAGFNPGRVVEERVTTPSEFKAEPEKVSYELTETIDFADQKKSEPYVQTFAPASNLSPEFPTR